ncbi:MAG TPA: P-type conjugative transfer protein TrbG [Ferrovibrio sp.]|uniref:P-type conjugative transfer protein TrbG n=1 Tax=Ferrovibrio sp. TaxID=1917215 RepID=UPI002ED166CE
MAALTMLGPTACRLDQAAPVPQIAYDSEDFVPAQAASEAPAAEPVKIVTMPEPLPLPGQLKPAPKAARSPAPGAAASALLPRDGIAAANQAARQEPDRDGYINAIQVYPFSEGALYRLYAMPEQVSDIALQPGETLISVSAGDTLRWVVGDTRSGPEGAERVHILIKPTAADLQTNLVITTDRRAYHLELVSTDETYMAAISWRYPADELAMLQNRNRRAEAASAVARGIPLERLRFRYAISGDTPPWRPLRAFDDGAKVYIQFPQRIDQGEAPPLFLVGSDGGSELVNYRMRGNYYIVDRLFAAAELRLGKAEQQVVRITRNDAGPAASEARP